MRALPHTVMAAFMPPNIEAKRFRIANTELSAARAWTPNCGNMQITQV